MAKKYKCRVEYLESTGTQWIDMGVGVKANTVFKATFSIASSAAGYSYFGARNSSNERFQIVNSIGIGAGYYLASSVYPIANQKYEIEMHANGEMYLDGVKRNATNGTFSQVSFERNLWLFATNYYDSSVPAGASTFWKAQVFEGDTLVRDLIPVLDLSGKPAMYDQVSGKLFYNKGTGEFTYGRQIIPVEYLESTGTQYIDTGIKGKNNLHYKSKINFTNLSTSGSNGIGGEYLANASAYIGMVRANGHYTYLFNNTAVETTTTIYANTDYEIDSVMNSGSQVLKVNGETISTGTLSGTFTSTRNIFLYAVCSTNDAADVYGSLKMYYCKIYDNDILVRDYIPCIDENLTPFMFDLVNCTVYLNAGTGQFKVGPNVEKVWGGKKLRRKLALALANLKKKRKYYCECEYLESTGTQYINTGLLSTENSKVDCVFGFSSMESGAANNAGVFGGRNNSTSTTFTFFKIASGSPQYFRFDYNGQPQVGTANQLTWDTSSKYRFQYDGISGITINITTGESVVRAISHASTFTTSPICLFAVNTAGTIGQYLSGRIYRYWYTDGTNTIDLIPVLDWDMTPCMYDRVTEQLFYNQGTGSFVAGRQIHPVEYLESTGTQYIDTGIQPTDDYGYRIRNTYTAGGGEQCAIGCMDSGNRFVGVYTGGPANAISGAWGSFVGFLPNYPWTTGTILDVEVNYKNSRKMIICGTELKDISDIHITGTISNSIYIGARNYGSTVTKMRGNIYGAEITNGQTVVADFIPMVDEQGVGAMFDKVTHTIFDNAGTGAGFNYPPVELEYVECVVRNTNKPFIDTGVYATENTRILAKLYTTDTGNRNYFGGNANGSGSSADGFVFNAMSTTQLEYLFGKGSGWKRADATNIVGIPFELDFSKSGVIVDGSVIDVPTYTSFPSQTLTVTLFVRNGGSAFINGRVYYFKMYENGTLVRDFIPAFKDGVACMVDKLTGTAYLNQGTGSFSVGRIMEPEYE